MKGDVTWMSLVMYLTDVDGAVEGDALGALLSASIVLVVEVELCNCGCGGGGTTCRSANKMRCV